MNNYEMMKSRESIVDFQVLGAIVVRPWPHHRRRLCQEITISFLMVRHTKFSPDWCFGLFKQMYRKTKVGNIHDIADVVNQSARVNHPQLIGDYDGTIT